MDSINDMQNYASLASMSRTQGQADALQGVDSMSVTQAKEAAKAFESYFVEAMLKQMRRTVPISEEGQGQAMSIFQGMFDGAVAEKVADGPGIGLAAMIEKSLLRSMNLNASVPQPMHEHGHGPSELVDMGRVSSAFGLRRDPITGAMAKHNGMDIAVAEGTPVLPLRGGRVVFSGQRGGYGETVIVDHGDGVESTYAHLKDRSVKVGDRVGRGEVLGHVGSTGRSTGPHLHLEVSEGGVKIDPADFFNR